MSWKEKLQNRFKKTKNQNSNTVDINNGKEILAADYALTKKDKSNSKKSFNNFFSFKRRATTQIIKFLDSKKIYNSFFYTDVNNLALILEQGIQPTGLIKLNSNQEYAVWTYLEHATYLELELGNSTRHFFWKWCAEHEVDANQIAIISIDLDSLFHETKKDWSINLNTNRLQINEKIPVSAVDWILVNEKVVWKQTQTILHSKHLNIKLFPEKNE